MDSTRIRGSHFPRLMRLTAAVAASAILPALLVAPARQASAATGSGPRVRPVRAGMVARRYGALIAHARSARSAAIPHAAAASAALTRARATGRPVVVAPDTTTTSLTVANPNGTFTNTINALPARVRQHGQWLPVSARLVRVHGVLSPVAATEPETLSAGGAGPLAVLRGSDGQSLRLWFPGKLPAPVVFGATATYRSVRPGIDLRLSATTIGGITQTLVVRTAAAAASGWLRRFTERYATAGGLRLKFDAAGNLLVVGRNGPVFGSAPAVVEVPAPAHRSAQPGASAPDQPTAVGRALISGDHIVNLIGGRPFANPTVFPLSVVIAVAPATVTSGSASVTPAPGSGAMNPDAFPSPKQLTPSGFVEAADVDGTGGCQNDMNWDGGPSGDVTKLGIGFQAWDSCMGIYQSYYVFDTSSISTNWDILHMELDLTEVQGSWDACAGTQGVSKEPVYLHSLGTNAGIGKDTDGANVSTLGSTSYEDDLWPANNPEANNGTGDGCPNQSAQFNVTSFGSDIQGHGNWTFAISGDTHNCNTCGQFMRFSDNPELLTTFDEYPPAPTMDQSTPAEMDNPATSDTNYGCASNSNQNPEIPWIGATSSIKLDADFNAALSDEQVMPGWLVGDQSTTLVDKTYADTGGDNVPVSWPYTFNNPVDGDEYTSIIWTTVDGNGGQNGYDPGEETLGPVCSFAVDSTPPKVPTVTSTAFPPSGSSPGTTQVAPGALGTFSFSSSDPPPSGCSSSNPIANAGFNGNVFTCLASGVYEFEYSLNQPLSSGNVTPITSCPGSGGVTSGAVAASNSTGNPTTDPSSNPSAATTGTSCKVSVNQWGTNILYVAAVDAAGNISQTYQYEFYVPWNSSAKVVPGSIVAVAGQPGYEVPDLLATDSSGNLVFFPGGTDPADGPLTASLAADAPEYSSFGDNWSHFIVTHRGSWSGNAVAADDLLALDTSNGNLYRYNNGDSATGMFEDPTKVVNMFYPGCTAIPTGDGGAGSANCTNYPTGGWSDFTQIIAPGDAWAGAPQGSSIIDDTSQPSMLGVASNGTLWLFQGSGGQLTNPVKLGSTGWNNVTVMAAGDVDGQDTIWARVNIGTDAGEIVSFPLTVPSGEVPTLEASSPGTLPAPTGGTALVDASGSPIQVPQGNFPTVTATGALSGNACTSTSNDTSGCPGLFAEDTSGDMFYFPGQATTTADDALSGTSELVGDVNGVNANSAMSAANDITDTILDLDAVGADGTLEQDVYNGKWSGWQGLGGSITGTPSLLYDNASGNQEVYVTTTSNTLAEYYWGTNSQGWKQLGGAIQGSPSAVVNLGSGNLEVYATGIDGSLQEDYWKPSDGWQGWRSLGVPSGVSLVNSPAAMYDSITSNLDVFCVGSNGDLYEIYWTPGGPGWSAWQNLGSLSGVSVTGTPSVVYDLASGNNEVYVTGSDGSLDEIYFSANSLTWSAWRSRGSTISGSPSAVYDEVSGDLDVYATTPGGTLVENSWDPITGWTGMVNRGGTIAGSPAAIYDNASLNTEIYAASPGETGQEIAYKSNGTWSAWTSLGGQLAG